MTRNDPPGHLQIKNECYLLLPSVFNFIVTVMLLKQLLDMQFYMVT